MYIEIRENKIGKKDVETLGKRGKPLESHSYAFYVKRSEWDKKLKKVKSTSVYLGSDYETAEAALNKMDEFLDDKTIFEQLAKAQENYEFKKAIAALTKLSDGLGNTKAGKEVAKLLERLIKSQKKYDDKSQKPTDEISQKLTAKKSQIKSDDKLQINSDDNTKPTIAELEKIGQTVLPIVPKCPSCKTGFLQERLEGQDTIISCTNSDCDYSSKKAKLK